MYASARFRRRPHLRLQKSVLARETVPSSGETTHDSKFHTLDVFVGLNVASFVLAVLLFVLSIKEIRRGFRLYKVPWQHPLACCSPARCS